MFIKVLVPNKFQFKSVPTFKSLISADRNEVHYIGGADVLPHLRSLVRRAMEKQNQC